MSDKSMVEALEMISRSIGKLADDLPEASRSDFPLMGETFAGLSDSITTAGNNIADGLRDLASAVRELKK
jgi:hypothetical protein